VDELRTTRQEIAHHEAAHVVIGAALGLGIVAVTILPDADYLGLCTFQPMPPDFQPDMYDAYDKDDPTPRLLEAHIIATMAGGIAGERAVGHYNAIGCDRDLTNALHMLCYLTGDPGNLQEAWDTLWSRTIDLVGKHWARIGTLALALLESDTLDQEATSALLSQAA